MKDFLSYCRLVKGTVASAGKIKGLRGAKLGNPYLRWAFGEAAVSGQTADPAGHRPLGPTTRSAAQQQVQEPIPCFAIKLARAVYFMLETENRLRPRTARRGR